MKLAIINRNPLFAFVEQALNERYECLIIHDPAHLQVDTVKRFEPAYCVFLHWSERISAAIYSNLHCILFHMTDLPYGRGGSPLQNLIVRGAKATKLSAITVTEKIDEGDIYLKKDLDLSGRASDIFVRAGYLMIDMVAEIVENSIQPVPQSGEAVYFKRRKPENGNLDLLDQLSDVYDHIRMLDAPGYPKAFLETASFRFEFDHAELHKESITANVRIYKK